MIEVIDEGVFNKDVVDPYWMYEMVRGSGLSHHQAILELREYILSVGLDPDCI